MWARRIVASCALVVGCSAPAQPPAHPATAQPRRDPDAVLRAIDDHFATVTPELLRYDKLTTYGDTLTDDAPTPEVAAVEKQLLADVRTAGLLTSLPDQTLTLGHNLVVHDPAVAEPFLRAIHAYATPDDKRVTGRFFVATLAAGEQGEQLAVADLSSPDEVHRAYWARYLERYAAYRSSVTPILARVAVESDPAIKASLVRALSMIGDPVALPEVRGLVEHATDDRVQAAAIFALAELAGFDAIAILDPLVPIGDASKAERTESLEWLRHETNAGDKHGRGIGNDTGFVDRFADLPSPAIQWIGAHGLLATAALDKPPLLAPDQTRELLAVILESKGFALEAVKGALFRSVTRADESMLLRVRAASFYSPSALSLDRASSIGIMLRTVRQER